MDAPFEGGRHPEVRARSASLEGRPPPQDARDVLRFVACGSVDDGKSTLIGRLLAETGAVPVDQIEALKQWSRKFGSAGDKLDYALLLDGLEAEREQGITIDVAYRYFATPRRAFLVADTPGHEQYTRNMATGASHAEVALILVDARNGITTQTFRHTRIAALLGIRRVLLVVNKMDLVGFAQTAFAAIRDEFHAFAAPLGISVVAIPAVARLQNPISFGSSTRVAVSAPLVTSILCLSAVTDAAAVWVPSRSV